MRVQLREPGEEHKETIDSGSRAAAAGGITAMVCLPNTEPAIDDVADVEFIARNAREVKQVTIFAHGTNTRGARRENLTQVGLDGVAASMGFTDGPRTDPGDPLVGRAAHNSRGRASSPPWSVCRTPGRLSTTWRSWSSSRAARAR